MRPRTTRRTALGLGVESTGTSTAEVGKVAKRICDALKTRGSQAFHERERKNKRRWMRSQEEAKRNAHKAMVGEDEVMRRKKVGRKGEEMAERRKRVVR